MAGMVEDPGKKTGGIVMYLDRVRSEILLKFNVLYWGIKYKKLGYGNSCIRYDSTLNWFLIFTKRKESVSVLLLTKESKTVIQGFVVYRFDNGNVQHSHPVSVKEVGDKRYKMEFPKTLIKVKGNKILRKNECLVLGITFDARRLLNTERGIYLEERDKTSSLLEAYEKRLFTDFIIRSRGKEFHVHKAILATRSIYFYQNMRGNKNEIVLNAEPRAVQNIIHYLYSGELPLVTMNELIDIFELSVKLLIPSLRDQCTVYFFDVMNKDNVGRIRDAATRAGVRPLVEAATQMCSSTE